MIPEALRDQLALVTEVRNALYPDKIGQPLNSNAKAFQITKHVAWRLRHLEIGLVKAKPGSSNNVEGYTSDVVALKSGAHWDVLVGSEEGAFPAWGLVEEQHWPAVAPRWAPPIDPATGDVTPKPAPGPVDTSVAAQIAAAVAPLKAQIAKLEADVARLEGGRPTPKVPSRIALKSAHGKFLSVEANGRVVADRDGVGGWETLEVIPQ